MVRRILFRDEAVLSHAQPESIDGLTRVDAPHQHLVTRTIGLVIIAFCVWLFVGTTDNNLWLQATASDPSQPSPPASDFVSSESFPMTAEFVSFVDAADVELLRPGSTVYMLRSRTSPNRVTEGWVKSVAAAADGTDSTSVAQWKLSTPSSYRLVTEFPMVVPPESASTSVRLRVPIGQQSVYRFLLGLIAGR